MGNTRINLVPCKPSFGEEYEPVDDEKTEFEDEMLDISSIPKEKPETLKAKVPTQKKVATTLVSP